MTANRARYGFRFYRGANGSKNCPTPELFTVASGYDGQDVDTASVDLNVGDPVSIVATGTVALAAADGASIYGVVVGFGQYWDGTRMVPAPKIPNQNVWGTNEARKPGVLVLPGRNVTFEVDVDDATTATTEAAYRAFIGENADHILTGDTAQTSAKPQLDVSTHVATAAGWAIVGISQSGENRDFSGANVKLLVQVNETSQAPKAFDAGT